MKRKLLSALFIPALFQGAFAQWNTNPALNNPICSQPYEQINPRLVSDLKGGAIIVWEDYRNDPTNKKADIYAQRINANGVLMWQADGVPVCTDTSDQTQPILLQDSSGGAIIVWEDKRGIKKNLYAQRIDSSGVVQWASNGIGVAPRNYEQKTARLLNDGSKGAIILWQDSVGLNYDIWGQRLDASGNVLWGSGVSVCTFTGSQINVKAVMTSSLEAIITWQDKRNGSDYDVYAQKLNLSGVAQWAANGIAVIAFAGTQSNPKIVLDNTGGAIISWQDNRNGTDYDVYAQRVNANGTLAWSANGVVICNSIYSQSAIDVTSTNVSNGAIISWKDGRVFNNTDIYAQKIDLSGAKLWTANGVLVATGNYSQLSPSIVDDNAGGAVIAYQDSSTGTWNIKGQRINGSGNLIWGSSGKDVGTAAGNQTNEKNIADGSGGCIFVFEDTRSGNSDIYVYKLDANGDPVGIAGLTDNVFSATVYPNPASDKVTLKWKDHFFSQHASIKFMDSNGKEIFSDEINNVSEYVLTKKLSSGIYYYTIENDKAITRGKFIVGN